MTHSTSLAVQMSLGISVGDQLVALGLVALAALCGGAVGFEREAANKSAGVRTHMLVGGASALAVVVGQLIFVSEVTGTGGDPARALHAVLTGIGFLCAGAIIRRDSNVEGLTTAASLWFAAAVGIAVGLELIVLAVGATLIALVVLRVVAMIEERVGEPGDLDPDD